MESSIRTCPMTMPAKSEAPMACWSICVCGCSCFITTMARLHHHDIISEGEEHAWSSVVIGCWPTELVAASPPSYLMLSTL